MSWVKLDDGFPQHPKVICLSLEARWAYIESLCYCARYETDGVVPDVVAANGSVRAELVASGLWESGTAAVRLHDFLVYNPTREHSRAVREARSRAGRASAATRVDGHVLGDGSGFEVEGGSGGDFAFDEFWGVYPRKVGKRTAAGAFVRAVKRSSVTAVIGGAERYRDDPNRSDEFTAHPTTWLNRDGWDDAPLPSHKNGSGPVKELRPYDHVDWDQVPR